MGGAHDEEVVAVEGLVKVNPIDVGAVQCEPVRDLVSDTGRPARSALHSVMAHTADGTRYRLQAGLHDSVGSPQPDGTPPATTERFAGVFAQVLQVVLRPAATA